MPAQQPSQPDPHTRPAGVDDTTVYAVGKLTEALEYVERARGHLFGVHQLVGQADCLLDDVTAALAKAGHDAAARLVREELLGRNVLDGRWTFQVVEEFDRTFYRVWQDVEAHVRQALLAGRRHVYEAEMKERRRSQGRPGHEERPAATYDDSVGS